YAFQSSIARAAEWLRRVGATLRIDFDICSAGASGGLDPDDVVADILPHPLSMAQKLLPSADLATLDWTAIRPAAGEWLIAAPIAGTLLTIHISMSARPTRFLTRIAADGGSIELDNFHDFAVALPGGEALDECVDEARAQCANVLIVRRDGTIVDAEGRRRGIADQPDIPAKRRCGVELASTRLVALLEDTVVPGSDWAKAATA